MLLVLAQTAPQGNLPGHPNRVLFFLLPHVFSFFRFTVSILTLYLIVSLYLLPSLDYKLSEDREQSLVFKAEQMMGKYMG